jgi:signal transduction histidine kinase
MKLYSPKSRWKIYQKIGYGYGLAIGIGFLGSLFGMLVADYYQGQGVWQLMDAQQQSQLLKELEQEAEAFQLHGTRLAILRDRPLQFQAEYDQLQVAAENVQALSLKVEQFIDSQPSWLATDAGELRSLVVDYRLRVTHDAEAIRFEWQRFQRSTSTSATTTDRLQTTLNAIAVGEEAMVLDALRRRLVEIGAIARAQERQAGDVMESAQGVEKLIIVLSMLGSVAIAGIIAWRTTRAIAQPIEHITQVAQQAAINSDLSVRVLIHSQDEVGSLAASFNALIEAVAERTQDLETAATQAAEQNQQLQRTLEILRRTQTQLVQTEKMSSLGQMIAGIAHEINNPVSFIYGNLNYIKQYVRDLLTLVHLYHRTFSHVTPEIQQHLDTIDLAFLQEDLPKLVASLDLGTERIRSIVLSLRIFSRLDEAEVKSVNIHDGLDSTLVILGNRLRAQSNHPEIHVMKHYGSIPAIECYPGHLNQVFMNILANAIDALEEYVNDPIGDRPSSWHPTITIHTAQQNDCVIMTFSDNGPGIPKLLQDKIFDPFFTTKAVGKGTGLGMSISYEIIVKKHNGAISLQSQEGVGTTFTIQLPIHLKPSSLPSPISPLQ